MYRQVKNRFLKLKIQSEVRDAEQRDRECAFELPEDIEAGKEGSNEAD